MARPIVKTREQLIKEKEEFHRKMAKLPWLRKIRIAREMQDMSNIWKKK